MAFEGFLYVSMGILGASTQRRGKSQPGVTYGKHAHGRLEACNLLISPRKMILII